MSKKGNKPVLLSAENYIRQRVRSLPMYECRINCDWKESGIASIVVARSHSNGNITACSFLVDTYCLGVKDSLFFFNRSAIEYQDLMDYYNEELEYEKVDYPLVHNIILAAEEYADELGFQPCKSYLQTTRFMLDEDDDNIEMIDIECGKDGKPCLILTGDEDAAMVKRYKERLDAKLGVGNYSCIYQYEEDDLVDNLSDDEKTFCQLFDQLEELDDDSLKRVTLLGKRIMKPLIEDNICNYFEDTYNSVLQMKLLKRKISPEFMGLSAGEMLPDKEAVKYFLKAVSNISGDQAVISIALKHLVRLLPGHPASHLVDLLMLRRVDVSLFESKVKQIALEYPNYGFLQLIQDAAVLKNYQKQACEKSIMLNFDKYFGNRTELHEIEMFEFLQQALRESLILENLNQVIALMIIIDQLNISEELKNLLISNSLSVSLMITREILEKKRTKVN